ncbi:MAG: DNA-directed RNA polymerase subunit beta' [Thermoguttaceae bacterium]
MGVSSEFTYDRINDYASVKISLARPQDIREWSFGEVKKPETINYRTYRPEREGLFCEKIFGPEKDWECACGKYRGMKYKGMTCDRCGVKITHSRVRRKRMGHVDLAAPVVHIWFFKATSSRLATLLAMKGSALEKVIYFQDYVVIDPKDTPFKVGQLLTEEEYRKARDEYPVGAFEADMGAEAIRKLLQNLDLVNLSIQLREELKEKTSKQRKKEIINRLKLAESLRDSDNKPEWMVLDAIPVIPPDLRPLVLLESGTFATSDLNDLYRRVINRNTRLKKLVDLNAPEVIIRNEKRMLQQSVDALFDNGRCKRHVLGSSNRPLKSLTDMIKGKQGRFRENLLGKRVDYSARSVIVVGPHLRLHQCGLPKKIALELFQPFIIRRLKELQHADTIKSAKKMLERKDEEVWDILEEVIQNHPVLLNRAPTLHRMGIQAFEPTLVEGNAIKLHPLVCRGFNADFDGDQMAVHLPLSLEAQVEAHTLMLSTNNIFSPANGAPIISPSQDVVMGCYYITMSRHSDDECKKVWDDVKNKRVGENRFQKLKGDGMQFSSYNELFLAYSHHIVDLHATVRVRMPESRWLKNDPKIKDGCVFETTPGRMIFNDILEKGMPYYNESLKSGGLATVISDCHEYVGRRGTIDLLDNLMRLGFEESTKSGLSFATDDLITPETKHKIIETAEKQVEKVRRRYEDGVITDTERYNQVLDTWTHAREEITAQMMKELEHDTRQDWYVNPIHLMATSGARGGTEQIRQLAGMRGLMAKPNGKIIETPIKANFREGLSVLEYFSSTHGARKGLADTALKTADSGYLTRKLADVAQNVVVTVDDCGTTQGIMKSVLYRGEKVEVSLADLIRGRISRVNIADPLSDDAMIVKENGLITVEVARKIEELGLEKIQIRSPMTCEAELGVCAKCYGMDLSTSKMVEQGLAVGIIAAQSIGEPGTQLTMRTFHIGGVAARDVEESEIRTKYPGRVKFVQLEVIETQDGQRISLSRNGAVAILDNRGRERDKYNVPIGASIAVKEDEEVVVGQSICNWDPHSVPILAKVSGIVNYVEIVDGETVRTEVDPNTGKTRRIVADLKGDRHPQIDLKNEAGTETLDFYYLPGRAMIEVENGDHVKRGALLAKSARDVSGTQDITGGLPRVTEIFEARKPKDPAVIAEIDGVVELGKKVHGKRTILIRNEETGAERIHEISHGKHMRVQKGDSVKAGQAITDGPLVPHDILRISGEEEVQAYLVREIQNVYRSQRVKINDKHIEIIVSQMLRKVRVESAGDTKLLEGVQIDMQTFKKANKDIAGCVKIVDSGSTPLEVGAIVQRDVFEQYNADAEAEGGKPASSKKTELAQASTQLLGITKAAVQSSSFISAASFQETTKVLTEAAIASKKDNLIGLKENVILGHLVPAGTGFRTYQLAEWKFSNDIPEEMMDDIQIAPKRSFALLEAIPDSSASEDNITKYHTDFNNDILTEVDDGDMFETGFDND